MKKLLICTLAAAACTALADATPYWTYANNTLTDGEWTLKVTGSRDALSVGSPTVKPSHGILDLTKPIDGGGTITAIAAQAFRSNTTLKELYLPETLAAIGESAFNSCTALTKVEPFLPAATVSLGNTCFGSCTSLAGTLAIGSDGSAVALGTSAFTYLKVTNMVFGAGVSTLPNTCFQNCQSVRDVTFTGGKPSISGEPFKNWDYRYHSGGFINCGQCRIHVPENDPSWQTWATANVTPWDDLTDTAAKNYYATRWTDGLVPYGRVNNGYSANGLIIQNQWLCFYTPAETSEETKDLVVTGLPDEYGAAAVSPAYGTYNDIAASPGLPLVLTAPQYAESGSFRYQCTGYVLETFDNMAWTGATTNALADPTAPSVTYNPSDAGLRRITWLWEVAGYRLSVADPPELSGGAVTVSGAGNGGFFTPESTAVVTATAGTAAFLRWHGDVPAGHETDAVLQLVMDGPKSLIAEFATDWVYSANKVTDGYWTLNVSGSRDALTVGKPTASASHGHLDLTKPIVDGGAFVAIGGQAFENSTATKLVDLPDTVTSIGATAFQRNTSLTRIRLSANLQSIGDSAFYQSTALAEVVPFLPASTVNFGYSCFNGCEALGGSLVLASGGGATRFSLSYQGTGAHFSGTAITNVTLGAGVTNLPVACFMRCYSLKSVRLDEALAEIGNQAFYQCTALEGVEPFLPAKTRTLGYQCFAGCTSLQGELSLATTGRRTGVVFVLDWQSNGSQFAQTPISAITLGAGVSTLPAGCFNQCRSVREVTFMGAAPAISSTAFGSWNQNQSVLRLPKGEPTWDAWIEANVTPWDSLDATARSAYAARWPDGKTPVGRTTSSAYPAQQYVLRWPGRGTTTVIVVQ